MLRVPELDRIGQDDFSDPAMTQIVEMLIDQGVIALVVVFDQVHRGRIVDLVDRHERDTVDPQIVGDHRIERPRGKEIAVDVDCPQKLFVSKDFHGSRPQHDHPVAVVGAEALGLLKNLLARFDRSQVVDPPDQPPPGAVVGAQRHKSTLAVDDRDVAAPLQPFERLAHGHRGGGEFRRQAVNSGKPPGVLSGQQPFLKNVTQQGISNFRHFLSNLHPFLKRING